MLAGDNTLNDKRDERIFDFFKRKFLMLRLTEQRMKKHHDPDLNNYVKSERLWNNLTIDFDKEGGRIHDQF